MPALLGPIVGYGVSLKLPSRYTSQTLVLVEEQKVPESFVKPVVTDLLEQRLATMQEQILSRSRLQPIVERFELFADNTKLSIDDKIELTRKATEIKPVRELILVAQGSRDFTSVSLLTILSSHSK